MILQLMNYLYFILLYNSINYTLYCIMYNILFKNALNVTIYQLNYKIIFQGI